MKLRHRKHVVMMAMMVSYMASVAHIRKMIDRALEPTPEELAESKAMMEDIWNNLAANMKAPTPPTELLWKVRRVRGKVVVLETSDLGEAEEEIQKAVRQKKAKLELVSPLEGCELVEYDPANFVHMV